MSTIGPRTLLGGFTAFCRLGSFSRLTLAWRVFGRARVDGEIGRIRSAPNRKTPAARRRTSHSRGAGLATSIKPT
jgi:hypothetical protein